MQSRPQPFPVHIHTGWIDFSPALHAFITTHVREALETFAHRVRAVTIRIADAEAGDRARRVCAIDLELKPVGTIATALAGTDPYDLVHRATRAVRAQLRAQAEADRAASLARIA
jgi:hypothetical protein